MKPYYKSNKKKIEESKKKKQEEKRNRRLGRKEDASQDASVGPAALPTSDPSQGSTEVLPGHN